MVSILWCVILAWFAFIAGFVSMAILSSGKVIGIDRDNERLRNSLIGAKAEAAAHKLSMEAVVKLYGPFPDFSKRLSEYVRKNGNKI